MTRLKLPSGRSNGCASQNRRDDRRQPTSTAASTVPEIGRRAAAAAARTAAISADADRQRRRAPDVRDLQRRRGDEALLVGVFERRPDDQQPGTPAPRRSRPRREGAPAPAARCATSAVMRMCSPRRNATTAPSIASHRNRIEASSSDQISGWWKHVARRSRRRTGSRSRRRPGSPPGSRPAQAERSARARASTQRSARRADRPPRPPSRCRVDLDMSHRVRASTAPTRVTTACRRTFPAAPRPRRRTCPSTRRRSRRRAACRGTAPASGWLNTRPLPASSCLQARVQLGDVLALLDGGVVDVLGDDGRAGRPAAPFPGAAVGQEPEAVPHVVGQRAVFLHLVQLGGRDDRQRVLLALDDLGLQRRIDLAEIDRGGRGVERLEHRGPQRRHRHADLEALEVVRPVDRLGRRRDLAEAVVPDLVHDHRGRPCRSRRGHRRRDRRPSPSRPCRSPGRRSRCR